jgi:[acyl-carrier-protein] S-malonyltransferase
VIARDKGAKRAVMLTVSAPFHSPLMTPAAEKMRAALAAVPLKAPSVPLVANVVAGPVTDPEEIRRKLVEQVTGMVRWRESVAWLGNAGVRVFVELGAGKVLSGLAKRIVDGVETFAVGTPDDVTVAVTRLSQ